MGENPIVAGENRVHFISAQAAIDAILQGNDNEYLKTFRSFMLSAEKFLVIELGSLKIKQFVTEINNLIQAGSNGLDQFEAALDGKLNLSETEKQTILEQIGEFSGRDVKIRRYADAVKQEVFGKVATGCVKWREGLGDRMTEESQYWSSEHSPLWSQDKLIQDYSNQFVRDLSKDIDDWVTNVILQEPLKRLDKNISGELKAIQSQLKNFDQMVKTNISEQFKLPINGIDDFRDWGAIGGIGVGGALAAGLLAFTGVGLVAIIGASLVTMIASSFGNTDGIKAQVLEIGLQKLDESKDTVFEKLDKIINSAFDNRVESASRVIAHAIALCENLLQQQEKAHQKTLKDREAAKPLITHKRQELEQVQNQVEAILSKSTAAC